MEESMLGEIVQDSEEEVKEKEEELVQRLKGDFSYAEVEREVLGWTGELFSRIMGRLLNLNNSSPRRHKDTKYC